MKKFLVAVVAAALLSTGLVAASSVAASAGTYPGTVKTRTHAVSVNVKAHHTAKIKTSVATYGKGKATGKTAFVFVNKKTAKVYTFSRKFSGAPTVFTFKGLKAGSYKVVVTFVPKKGSVYKASSGSTSVKVK